MIWEEVCNDPNLQDLPYKIELNRFGQIVMSPVSNWHGILQSKIVRLLGNFRESGTIITECSIETSDRTKVADVAWCSDAFAEKNGRKTPFPDAPEICVEILSPSNSEEEMRIKRSLYFEAGAKEVWECDQDGVMIFYRESGVIENSEIASKFPKRM